MILKRMVEVLYYPKGHPYAGFAYCPTSQIDTEQSGRFIKAADDWRLEEDEWIIKVVGPFRSRRKKKKRDPVMDKPIEGIGL